jgi:(E)-4-hydroxy-3-methylbut-2-enyl-diphosphate synthase
MIFANSLTEYSRFATRPVQVGSLTIGGGAPIRIQSMTTADTMNTQATVAEAIQLINAGAELVRITAPSKAEAENLANIKHQLRTQGYNTPLVADIHFTPNAAEIAARIVEKVRINPGNYADKKKFEHINYTETAYQNELERIREKFVPLIKICKEYGTAMRIGTNHGSLSDRILSKYGDTPQGMVESAMEFLRIAESENYYNLVLSMKASNPQVMMQAYRLLVATMRQNNMNYPLHLGVTEAGDGEDGRIKSALGIGALLEDGLGDTIRVSLTEDPVNELPVCIQLKDRYNHRATTQTAIAPLSDEDNKLLDLFHYHKRNSQQIFNTGGGEVARIIADFGTAGIANIQALKDVGHHYLPALDKWSIGDQAADFVFLGDNHVDFDIPPQLKAIYNYKTYIHLPNKTRCYPLLSAAQYIATQGQISEMNFVKITINDLNADLIHRLNADKSKAILVIYTNNAHAMPELRRLFVSLQQNNIHNPVIIHRNYAADPNWAIYAATDAGALLTDGLGDGVWLTTHTDPPKVANSIAFGILQAARVRISKTEYIACPSCGRTLFDLQETTAKIRSVTNHLKGVKIGIMGCIVNGPGEMADADFGYVGSGIGKITLYKGQQVMQRNLPEAQAVSALVQLIKDSGAWVEKSAEQYL